MSTNNTTPVIPNTYNTSKLITRAALFVQDELVSYVGEEYKHGFDNYLNVLAYSLEACGYFADNPPHDVHKGGINYTSIISDNGSEQYNPTLHNLIQVIFSISALEPTPKVTITVQHPGTRDANGYYSDKPVEQPILTKVFI